MDQMGHSNLAEEMDREVESARRLVVVHVLFLRFTIILMLLLFLVLCRLWMNDLNGGLISFDQILNGPTLLANDNGRSNRDAAILVWHSGTPEMRHDDDAIHTGMTSSHLFQSVNALGRQVRDDGG